MELNSVEREVEREEFRAPAREGHLQIGHGNVSALLPNSRNERGTVSQLSCCSQLRVGFKVSIAYKTVLHAL